MQSCLAATSWQWSLWSVASPSLWTKCCIRPFGPKWSTSTSQFQPKGGGEKTEWRTQPHISLLSRNWSHDHTSLWGSWELSLFRAAMNTAQDRITQRKGNGYEAETNRLCRSPWALLCLSSCLRQPQIVKGFPGNYWRIWYTSTSTSTHTHTQMSCIVNHKFFTKIKKKRTVEPHIQRYCIDPRLWPRGWSRLSAQERT